LRRAFGGQDDASPLAYRREKAARALDVSPDTFDRHIAPSLKRVQVNSIWVYPITELRRWLDDNADGRLGT
jgi:hypothetical protein